jgi:hypothetical protein
MHLDMPPWDKLVPAGSLQDRTQRAVEMMLATYAANPGAPQDQITPELLRGELYWERWKRPYFKVWPAIIDLLATTRLQFPGEYLTLPFYVFEIRLPAEHPMARKTGGSVLVFYMEHNDKSLDPDGLVEMFGMPRSVAEPLARQNRAVYRDGLRGVLKIHYYMPGDHHGVVTCHDLQIVAGQTVEESLARTQEHTRPNDVGDCTFLPHDDQHAILSLVCGVAMFATNNHELVGLDIPREETKPRNTRERIAQEIRDAKAKRHCRGWTVGRDIQIPRAEHHEPERDGPARTLSHGHVRSGHMRLQAHGPKLQERKLIFVHPCMVRPDLPMKQSGYAVA